MTLENESEITDKIDNGLQSEAMQEMISTKSNFLSKYALLIFCLILSIITSVAWFIHYPDVINTRATIVAVNLPKEIITRSEGRIVKLFIRNGDSVATGDILAFVESNASTENILKLDKQLDSCMLDLKSGQSQNILRRLDYDADSLGELQVSYQQFKSAIQQFRDYIEGGYYVNSKKELFNDLATLQKSKSVILQQKELFEKDLKLSEENYESNAKLFKEKVIAKQDDRNEQSKLLSKQMTIPQINGNILANEAQQRQKEHEIRELEHTISLQLAIFQQQVQTLQSSIVDWTKKYVIKAPTYGRVTFIIPVQEKSFYSANRLLGYVSPSVVEYYAETSLPQINFGKVEKGQIVQLRIDAYPYAEFGYVVGKLNYITEFATDTGFLAHIALPNGLITNRQQILSYRNGLKAEARIITKDMRLFDKLFYDLRKVIEN